jgi:hypothetical protein
MRGHCLPRGPLPGRSRDPASARQPSEDLQPSCAWTIVMVMVMALRLKLRLRSRLRSACKECAHRRLGVKFKFEDKPYPYGVLILVLYGLVVLISSHLTVRYCFGRGRLCPAWLPAGKSGFDMLRARVPVSWALRSWGGETGDGGTGPQLCAWAKETQAQRDLLPCCLSVSSLVSSLCILCRLLCCCSLWLV